MESEDAESFTNKLRNSGLGGSALGEALEAARKGSGKSGGKGDAGAGGAAAASGTAGGGGGSVAQVPRLTKQLAQKYAKNNIIIVTWANFHFSDFVVNWVKHVKSHGITNYLVGAMDVETAEVLVTEGVQVFAMYTEGANSTGLGSGDMGWGSPTFYKMGRQKVDLARTFSQYGLDLCLCDVDTVWINADRTRAPSRPHASPATHPRPQSTLSRSSLPRPPSPDPTKYFARFPEADILASSDQLAPTIPPGDEGLEEPEAIHSAMNIGLLYFRHSENTTKFVVEWARRLEEDPKVWDQNVFNWVARDGLLPFQRHHSNPRLVWAANHSVVVGVLPVASFASGHTFFVQRLYEYQKVPAYVVHCTFQYGGSKGKRNRLREAKLWFDPPSYYSEGKFLSVDLHFPPVSANFQDHTTLMMNNRFKTTWRDPEMQEAHLTRMHDQLGQLKQAFAVAVALNRTIIMPKLLCLCDRYWGPVEYCQVPGAFKLRLPYTCPLDHVLEPYNFDDPKVAAPPIHFREYSFLENPQTPRSIANEVQLRQIFAPYAATQLLHLTTAAGVFGKWEDAALGQQFQQRINHMVGFWCCKRKTREDEDAGFPYIKFVVPGADGTAPKELATFLQLNGTAVS
eukprot:scaffold9.g3129.t1